MQTIDENNKMCIKCKVYKPFSEFYKNTWQKYQSMCKLCSIEISKTYQKMHYIPKKSLNKVITDKRTCKVCKLEKPIIDFNQFSDGKYLYKCTSCIKEWHKSHYIMKKQCIISSNV
jgi:hypothetical protein